MKTRKKGIVILSRHARERIYGGTLLDEIAERIDLVAPPQTSESIQAQRGLLAEVEVLFTGWGAPRLDEEFLAHAPKLRAVFHGAGSVRRFITEAFWERGIALTTARAINARPVAEFTLGAILLSLKRTWHYALGVQRLGHFPPQAPVPGVYGSTVGIVSFGLIGQRLRNLLMPFELNVLVYDPYVSSSRATEHDVTLSSLDDLFAQSDVVSLHTPLLPTTRQMIRGRHFRRMKRGATFINTARGAVVHEPEMISILQERADLTAFLDVTEVEPPSPGSPLYHLPNVVLTPHIAGSLDRECLRMGQEMVREYDRWVAGREMNGLLTKELMTLQA